MVGATGFFGANGTGDRYGEIVYNGVTNITFQNSPADAINGSSISLHGLYRFSTGDYIELYVHQESTTTLTFNSAALWAIWVPS